MGNVVKLNNQDFVFQGFIFSGDANSAEISEDYSLISYGNIGSIEIIDSMFNVDYDGKIIFKNQYNVIDNLIKFRANNKSGVYIRLSPADVSSTSTEEPKPLDQIGLNFWGIFADGSSLNSDRANSTINLYQFISPFDAALREKKASVLNKTSIPSPFQIKGDKKLGSYLREVINSVRPQDKPCRIYLYKNGTFSEEVDGDQSLVYQVPLHFTLHDLLDLLLKLYIVEDSGVYSQCILIHEKQGDIFYLVPFTSIIGNIADRTNNETFVVGSQGDENPSTDINVIASKQNKQNIIQGFAFSDVSFDVANSYMNDVAVVQGENLNNNTIINYLRVRELINKVNQNIVSKLSNKGYSNPTINVDLDESKDGVEAKNYRVVSFPYQNINHVGTAEALMVGDMLFSNMQLQFQTLGAPYRKAGVFINIARDSSDETFTNLDDKVIGQWLVVELTHKIVEDKYYNVFKCVKPFRNA